MQPSPKWSLSDAEKNNFITMLTPNLPVLRTQADISQEELANLVGVSRQTYGAIERKSRKMSWNTYLSLILFFDHNRKTHNLIRHLSLFPTELVVRFNEGIDYSNYEWGAILGEKTQEIVGQLDAQALQRIRDVAVSEYARCAQMPEDAIIKSFDGMKNGISPAVNRDIEAMKAIRAIIKKTEKYDK